MADLNRLTFNLYLSLIYIYLNTSVSLFLSACFVLKASVEIDRKILADIAVHDKAAFTALVDTAKETAKRREARDERPICRRARSDRGARSTRTGDRVL